MQKFRAFAAAYNYRLSCNKCISGAQDPELNDVQNQIVLELRTYHSVINHCTTSPENKTIRLSELTPANCDLLSYLYASHVSFVSRMRDDPSHFMG